MSTTLEDYQRLTNRFRDMDGAIFGIGSFVFFGHEIYLVLEGSTQKWLVLKPTGRDVRLNGVLPQQVRLVCK